MPLSPNMVVWWARSAERPVGFGDPGVWYPRYLMLSWGVVSFSHSYMPTDAAVSIRVCLLSCKCIRLTCPKPHFAFRIFCLLVAILRCLSILWLGDWHWSNFLLFVIKYIICCFVSCHEMLSRQILSICLLHCGSAYLLLFCCYMQQWVHVIFIQVQWDHASHLLLWCIHSINLLLSHLIKPLRAVTFCSCSLFVWKENIIWIWKNDPPKYFITLSL